MPGARAINIVGGGLAGLTLGIGLRQRNVPVVLWEAGKYPRHRVCGEFISGKGQRVLDKLSLLDLLVRAGARRAETVAICTPGFTSAPIRLPEPALCLARIKLDELLARHFSGMGGELRLNQRRQGVGEGIVRASGRCARAIVDGWRWFGLKAHARGAVLRADLEMHLDHDSYVGLCRLADDEVNICGLFRSRTAVPDIAVRWRDWLRGPPGSHLRDRLRNAVFDEASFCSVSGLSLDQPKQNDEGECRIGDAWTMIPPITGNGMSMAFESAEIALPPLEAYSRDEIGWAETCRKIAHACDHAFAGRLAWAAPLQWMLFQTQFRPTLVFLTAQCPWLFRVFFSKTR
jgi:menaquinone-9 beta-reductase